MSEELPATQRAAVDAAIARLRDAPGALLPILHAVQDALGHVPPAAVPAIAQALNLSRAEVHGVVGFYHHFRTTPSGRTVLRLCRAEACQAVGGRALERHVRATLGIDFHETTSDGRYTLEPVYCLGNCACAPSLLVGETLHGRVDAAAFDALVSPAAAASAPRASAARVAPAPAAATVYVPRDASALSVGADAVAHAIAAEAAARGADVRVVRNGSRGAFWLEPLVEVATPAGRVAYGPVGAGDVTSLFDAGLLAGGAHPLRLGAPESIPYLRDQQRLCFARCGVVDPLDPEDYRAHGGWRGAERALALAPAEIVQEVTASGLRGRGGAAFPAGVKWKTALETPAPVKYVVANADEGDSGTFADRLLMEGDPFALIEGMLIAALAVGATQGYVYLRVEYPHAYATLRAAVARAYRDGWLGADVRGSRRAFDLDVRLAAGAYVCGEETSLLESLEGKRGQVRYKPPVPAVQGLFGAPTVVNNVVTLASVPAILANGGAWYRDFGVGRSRGTLPLQLAGNVKRGGLVEVAFGPTLRELLYEYGGGSASGRPIRAVQVGGPLGAYLPESRFDTPIDYEAFTAIGAMLGHGGIVVFDDGVDMGEQARFAMELCAIESCGKCTPCRIGSVRGVETIDRIRAGERRAENEALLRELCDTMLKGSLCALGGMAPYPVLSALDHFGEDFAR